MTDESAAGSAAPDASSPASGYAGHAVVQAEWDRRYADRQRMWSGQPNGALLAEVAGLSPGRVLDVGCGEGADAVWLARGGWDVTAVEVSGVALERAAGHARDAGVSVRWVHGGLAESALPPASFDLVSAQYPALLRTLDAAAERALLAAVARGGALLLVHHAGMQTQQVHDSGFDPADYVWPRWSPPCWTTAGTWKWTSSGRASPPKTGPERIRSTTWSFAPAGCASARTP